MLRPCTAARGRAAGLLLALLLPRSSGEHDAFPSRFLFTHSRHSTATEGCEGRTSFTCRPIAGRVNRSQRGHGGQAALVNPLPARLPWCSSTRWARSVSRPPAAAATSRSAIHIPLQPAGRSRPPPTSPRKIPRGHHAQITHSRTAWRSREPVATGAQNGGSARGYLELFAREPAFTVEGVPAVTVALWRLAGDEQWRRDRSATRRARSASMPILTGRAGCSRSSTGVPAATSNTPASTSDANCPPTLSRRSSSTTR
jgi:hypothetical protein